MGTYAPISMSPGETLGEVAWSLMSPSLNPLLNPTDTLDSTGWSAELNVLPYRGSPTVILNLKSSTGGLVITNGVTTPVISHSTSAALPLGTYFYKLVHTFGDGNETETFYGEWIVL